MTKNNKKNVKHKEFSFNLIRQIDTNCEYVKMNFPNGKVLSFSVEENGRYVIIHQDTTIRDITISKGIKPEIVINDEIFMIIKSKIE